MQLILEEKEISDRIAERVPDIVPYPESFVENTIQIGKGERLRLAAECSVKGSSTHGNRPTRVTMRPTTERPVFRIQGGGQWPLSPDETVKGFHNIQLGEIQILEHPLALMSVFGLDFDLECVEPSLPSFSDCDRPYVEALAPNVATEKHPARITVKRPLLGQFERGYFILEPGNDDDAWLTIDHELRYPYESVGQQRIRFEITPERFQYFCSARTPSIRSNQETQQIFAALDSGMDTGYSLNRENVLFIDEDQIHNPRKEFEHEGRNYELLLHEVIDMISWIKFLELEYGARFVGTLYTSLFDHHQQIDAARAACSPGFSEHIVRL